MVFGIFTVDFCNIFKRENLNIISVNQDNESEA